VNTKRWVLLAMLTIMDGVPIFNNQGFAQSCGGRVVCIVQLTFGPSQGSRPSTNDQEFVYESNGPVIVSNIRGALAEGIRPDIGATGEVVYVRDVIGSDGRNRPQIFSTTRGQLTSIEDPNNAGADNPSINSFGEVVYMARDLQNQTQIFSTIRGQLTFITGDTGLSSPEHPEIDDNGRVVFAMHGPDGAGSATANIWEVDSGENITQLTFHNFPEEAVQPTLAAETGELVYVVFNQQTHVLSLVSERDGELFVAAPDPGANFGVFPDLSPKGLLVFQGFVDSADQTWLGIRASDGEGKVCSFSGIVCPIIPESDLDGDGVSDDKDECPNSDLSSTVIVGSCNSRVTNTLFPTGCTISDQIVECTTGANNHGKFVSCVAHFTNTLKKNGTITGQEKGAIQSCAAQANIP
jgi:hypothetical protein